DGFAVPAERFLPGPVLFEKNFHRRIASELAFADLIAAERIAFRETGHPEINIVVKACGSIPDPPRSGSVRRGFPTVFFQERIDYLSLVPGNVFVKKMVSVRGKIIGKKGLRRVDE